MAKYLDNYSEIINGGPKSAKFENKNKMADGCFAISNQTDIEQLKENSKNQNTLKATQTCAG